MSKPSYSISGMGVDDFVCDPGEQAPEDVVVDQTQSFVLPLSVREDGTFLEEHFKLYVSL